MRTKILRCISLDKLHIHPLTPFLPMRLSTLKLFVLSLFVALTTTVAAQTTAYQGDGSKQKPYLIAQIMGNEELLGQLMDGSSKKFYVIAPFVGFGPEGAAALSEAAENSYVMLLGDTATHQVDSTASADNAALVISYLPAKANEKLTETMSKLDFAGKKFYAWYGSFVLDEDLGDNIFVVEDVLADPTSIARVAQKAPAPRGVFDLSGRLVQTQYEPSLLPQGLYIVNGKKVVVK